MIRVVSTLDPRNPILSNKANMYTKDTQNQMGSGPVNAGEGMRGGNVGSSSAPKKVTGEFQYHVESLFMGRSKILVNEAIWSKIPVIK